MNISSETKTSCISLSHLTLKLEVAKAIFRYPGPFYLRHVSLYKTAHGILKITTYIQNDVDLNIHLLKQDEWENARGLNFQGCRVTPLFKTEKTTLTFYNIFKKLEFDQNFKNEEWKIYLSDMESRYNKLYGRKELPLHTPLVDRVFVGYLDSERGIMGTLNQGFNLFEEEV